MIRAATQDEIRYICEKISFQYNENSNAVLIEDEVGGVGAMAIYDRWTNTAVEMHAYSKHPKYVFRPEFCSAMFEYPFIQQNKMLAFAVTPCDNVASLALARFLGFNEVYRIHDGWDLGTDMVIQEIRRENCRFLEKIDHGKSPKESSALDRPNREPGSQGNREHHRIRRRSQDCGGSSGVRSL